MVFRQFKDLYGKNVAKKTVLQWLAEKPRTLAETRVAFSIEDPEFEFKRVAGRTQLVHKHRSVIVDGQVATLTKARKMLKSFSTVREATRTIKPPKRFKIARAEGRKGLVVMKERSDEEIKRFDARGKLCLVKATLWFEEAGRQHKHKTLKSFEGVECYKFRDVDVIIPLQLAQLGVITINNVNPFDRFIESLLARRDEAENGTCLHWSGIEANPKTYIHAVEFGEPLNLPRGKKFEYSKGLLTAGLTQATLDSLVTRTARAVCHKQTSTYINVKAKSYRQMFLNEYAADFLAKAPQSNLNVDITKIKDGQCVLATALLRQDGQYVAEGDKKSRLKRKRPEDNIPAGPATLEDLQRHQKSLGGILVVIDQLDNVVHSYRPPHYDMRKHNKVPVIYALANNGHLTAIHDIESFKSRFLYDEEAGCFSAKRAKLTAPSAFDLPKRDKSGNARNSLGQSRPYFVKSDTVEGTLNGVLATIITILKAPADRDCQEDFDCPEGDNPPLKDNHLIKVAARDTKDLVYALLDAGIFPDNTLVDSFVLKHGGIKFRVVACNDIEDEPSVDYDDESQFLKHVDLMRLCQLNILDPRGRSDPRPEVLQTIRDLQPTVLRGHIGLMAAKKLVDQWEDDPRLPDYCLPFAEGWEQPCPIDVLEADPLAKDQRLCLDCSGTVHVAPRRVEKLTTANHRVVVENDIVKAHPAALLRMGGLFVAGKFSDFQPKGDSDPLMAKALYIVEYTAEQPTLYFRSTFGVYHGVFLMEQAGRNVDWVVHAELVATDFITLDQLPELNKLVYHESDLPPVLRKFVVNVCMGKLRTSENRKRRARAYLSHDEALEGMRLMKAEDQSIGVRVVPRITTDQKVWYAVEEEAVTPLESSYELTGIGLVDGTNARLQQIHEAYSEHLSNFDIDVSIAVNADAYQLSCPEDSIPHLMHIQEEFEKRYPHFYPDDGATGADKVGLFKVDKYPLTGKLKVGKIICARPLQFFENAMDWDGVRKIAMDSADSRQQCALDSMNGAEKGEGLSAFVEEMKAGFLGTLPITRPQEWTDHSIKSEERFDEDTEAYNKELSECMHKCLDEAGGVAFEAPPGHGKSHAWEHFLDGRKTIVLTPMHTVRERLEEKGLTNVFTVNSWRKAEKEDEDGAWAAFAEAEYVVFEEYCMFNVTQWKCAFKVVDAYPHLKRVLAGDPKQMPSPEHCLNNLDLAGKMALYKRNAIELAKGQRILLTVNKRVVKEQRALHSAMMASIWENPRGIDPFSHHLWKANTEVVKSLDSCPSDSNGTFCTFLNATAVGIATEVLRTSGRQYGFEVGEEVTYRGGTQGGGAIPQNSRWLIESCDTGVFTLNKLGLPFKKPREKVQEPLTEEEKKKRAVLDRKNEKRREKRAAESVCFAPGSDKVRFHKPPRSKKAKKPILTPEGKRLETALGLRTNYRHRFANTAFGQQGGTQKWNVLFDLTDPHLMHDKLYRHYLWTGLGRLSELTPRHDAEGRPVAGLFIFDDACAQDIKRSGYATIGIPSEKDLVNKQSVGYRELEKRIKDYERQDEDRRLPWKYWPIDKHITPQWWGNKWHLQRGICAHEDCDGELVGSNMVVDRINSQMPHLKTNCRLLCKTCNLSDSPAQRSQ